MSVFRQLLCHQLLKVVVPGVDVVQCQLATTLLFRVAPDLGVLEALCAMIAQGAFCNLQDLLLLCHAATLQVR